MSPAAYVAIGAVRTYQWTVRPFIGANCRFWPSCSEYAVDAVRQHGAVRGAALAGWRILRCNPWCAGGYDPVPPRASLHCTAVPSQIGEPAPNLDIAPDAGSDAGPRDIHPAIHPPPASATRRHDYGKSL